jgi:hypothetical protein
MQEFGRWRDLRKASGEASALSDCNHICNARLNTWQAKAQSAIPSAIFPGKLGAFGRI